MVIVKSSSPFIRDCQSLSVWCFSSFMYDVFEKNKKTNLPIISIMTESIITHVMWFLVTKFYSVVKKWTKRKCVYLLPFCRSFTADILKTVQQRYFSAVSVIWNQDIINVIVIYMQSQIYDKIPQTL